MRTHEINWCFFLDIFKLFNPKLLGPSTMMTMHGHPTTVNETSFNFAVTGHNTL